jgi:hypothetical protein
MNMGQLTLLRIPLKLLLSTLAVLLVVLCSPPAGHPLVTCGSTAAYAQADSVNANLDLPLITGAFSAGTKDWTGADKLALQGARQGFSQLNTSVRNSSSNLVNDTEQKRIAKFEAEYQAICDSYALPLREFSMILHVRNGMRVYALNNAPYSILQEAKDLSVWSTYHPEVKYLTIDDFQVTLIAIYHDAQKRASGSPAQKDAAGKAAQVEFVDAVTNAMAVNPALKLGVTIYDNELVWHDGANLFTDSSKGAYLPQRERELINRVYLYSHYRDNLDTLDKIDNYVSIIHHTFPNTAPEKGGSIMGGIYVYDATLYLKCEELPDWKQEGNCTPEREWQRLEGQLQAAKAALDRGVYYGLELAPAWFGQMYLTSPDKVTTDNPQGYVISPMSLATWACGLNPRGKCFSTDPAVNTSGYSDAVARKQTEAAQWLALKILRQGG